MRWRLGRSLSASCPPGPARTAGPGPEEAGAAAVLRSQESPDVSAAVGASGAQVLHLVMTPLRFPSGEPPTHPLSLSLRRVT